MTPGSAIPPDHVETQIAAAASLAGLLILSTRVPAVSAMQPGTVILSPMDTGMNEMLDFMAGVCTSFGLDSSGGWNLEIPEKHKPLCSIPEMTQKIEKDFLAICSTDNVLQKEFFPYVAVLASLKLVAGANKLHLPDQNIGRALAWYHVYAGARTVPYPGSG